jgi:hypothetical protein
VNVVARTGERRAATKPALRLTRRRFGHRGRFLHRILSL